MRYKNRYDEIAALKLKHPRRRRSVIEFPDLTVSNDLPTCSNGFGLRGQAVSWKHEQPADAQYFPVGHCHKQGTQLITPGQIQNELQWMGGRKS
jgi:hypothetical protein